MWLYLVPLAVLLLVVLRKAYLVLFAGRSPNPFAENTKRPPATLVTDKAARKKVLKQAFSARRVPEKLDVVVIGSGFGGLAAAANLAKAGKRVLVLEQHTKAGGCCHTFRQDGLEFDTDGQLDWVALSSPFDVMVLDGPNGRKEFPMYSGEKAYVQGLKEKFPHEAAAVDKYMKLVKASTQSIFEILRQLPASLELQAVLSYIFPTYWP